MAHINQSTLNIDRGSKLDFAVMVESYVSNKRIVAKRHMGESGNIYRDVTLSDSVTIDDEEPLQNGSILRVLYSPWVELDNKVVDKKLSIAQFFRVVVETEGRKPLYSLEAKQITT